MPLRAIEPEDFLDYRTISQPSFSKDGKRIAISVQQANKEEDLYNSDILIVGADGGETTRFTYGGKDYSPKFSPDGKSILFLSKRTIGKDEKGNELYVMPLVGGEPRRLLKRKEGIESPEFSSDSKIVYFLSKVIPEEEKDGVKIVKRIQLWFNGEGFVYNARRHLFSINIETGDLKQITSGEFDVVALHPSNDGKWIGYLASTDDLKPYITDVFLYDGNNTRKITKSNMTISDFAWSPDDSKISINADDLPRGFASNSHIWLLDLKEGSKPKKLENTDLSKGNSLNSDARQGAHASTSIAWDGDYVYYLQANGGSVHLCKVKPGGKSEVVVGGDRSVESYDVTNGRLAFVSMDSTHLEELSILANEEKKLTSFNDAIYSQLEILHPEWFSFRASDGAEIDCWILAKNVVQESPTIVYVHGGPKTAFGNSYMHELQVLASKGYVVLYANIRGSDGYSEDFADIRAHYGERDFKDILEMIEFASNKFPFIDKNKLGIAGGSYGGFMTNWAIGHTDIFKAAVTDRSIASWSSFFGTSDIGPYFTKDQIGNDPFVGQNQLDSMSPISYVSKIKTPLLIVHSTEDYRCWMVEGLQMFTSLKYLGRETEMVLFSEENHDLSRIGKPKHRIARLGHYLRWFDKYLKGTETK
jgi:dipeptidyl aminopeptidase/acylaminoacyl peptidase